MTPPHLITLILLTGFSPLSLNMFMPSLGNMALDLRTDYATIVWSVSGYLAITALLQLLIGPISDKVGRRNITLWCLAIFILATVGCAMAPSVETFLVFRMLQGVSAVGIVVSRAIVRDLYEQDEAASMIGYVTMGMALVPMIAPSIGGALDEAFGWRSIFWALAAAGTGLMLLCLTDLGETAKGGGISFTQQVRDYPELLTSRRFWGYVFSAAFASGAFFAFLGGAPYVASTVFGLSSFWTGVCLGAPAVGYATGNYFSARYSVKKGVNWMIRLGAALAFVGLGVAMILFLAGYSSALLFFSFCAFVGLGNGLVIPNASAGMLSVRPHLAGSASGLGGAIMIGGGAALSALAGSLIQKGGGVIMLLSIMMASLLFGLLAILYVIWREKQLDLP